MTTKLLAWWLRAAAAGRVGALLPDVADALERTSWESGGEAWGSAAE